MKICARCEKELALEKKVPREALCPHCGAYLHACANCTFYSPGSHNDCREPQAEHVRDKRSGNFCDYFVFAESKPGGTSSEEDRKKTVRDTFKKLFGD